MPNGQVLEAISRHDLFVLPSRFDGWGAVVNEALMCGVPVVCSEACGAADLVAAPWRGESFAAGSVAALREVLERRIEAGPTSSETRDRIRDWSCCISGKAVSHYLLAVVDAAAGRAPRPRPAWREA
jgi:glycosyltransferase involved in cell wall biosynthesis